MKKLISVLLCLVLVMGVLPLSAAPARADDDGDWEYEITDGEATVTKYTGSGVNVVIPESLGGCPVTSIGEWAFSYCSSLTSVTIPEGVTSIGNSTFYNCSSLTSVTIPEGVTSIGNSAFSRCSGLTSVTIPESVTSIGNSVFSNCSSLESVTIPASVTSIGSYAFSDCSSLTSVTIPEGVTSIGSYAFSGCSGLTSVTIPEGVTNIGEGAFYGCSSLTSVTIPEGVTSIGNSAFCGCSSLTSVTIPEGVTSIGNSAFSGCMTLSDVTLSVGLTDISEYAFKDCISLRSLTIPEGVTSIGAYAFSNCTTLKTAVIPNSVVSIGEAAYSGCSSLESISIPFVSFRVPIKDSSDVMLYHFGYIFGQSDYGSSTAVSQLVRHGTTFNNSGDQYDYNTYHRDKYVTFYIPSSLHSVTINGGGFYCDSRGLYFRDYVFAKALENCTMITSVTFGEGVRGISAQAFRGCTELVELHFSENLSWVAFSAFSDRKKDVYYPGNFIQWDEIDGDEYVNASWIYFGDSEGQGFCGDAIRVVGNTDTGELKISGTGEITSTPWLCVGPFWTSVTISSGITKIPDHAFRNCISLRDVYYDDNQSAWAAISIGTNNSYLTEATIHYNYSPVAITTQPSSVTAALGSTATFKVVADGADLSYQWQYQLPGSSAWKNSPATGNKTATLTVPATTDRSGNKYRCKVTNAAGEVYSSAATLTVTGGGLKITTQPANATVVEGNNATFKVVASGQSLTYQWQVCEAGKTTWKDSPATGNKTATLTVPATTSRSGYKYRCIVTSGSNSVASSAATLTVTAGVKITTQPANATVVEGNNATFKMVDSGSGLA